jgi:hypothetical protein
MGNSSKTLGSTSKGHYCVDYCQPPEHADLCHANTDWQDDLSAHYEFEDTYGPRFCLSFSSLFRLCRLLTLPLSVSFFTKIVYKVFTQNGSPLLNSPECVPRVPNVPCSV